MSLIQYKAIVHRHEFVKICATEHVVAQRDSVVLWAFVPMVHFV